MDIGAIGTQYFEQYRYGVENLAIARNSETAAAAGTPSFDEYLKKAGSETGAGRNPAPSSGPRTPPVDKTSKLYEQCLELETFLVKNLLTGMRSTVQKSGLISEGLAGEFYEDMLWDEYAKSFTRNAGFGLAEQAYRELTGQRFSRIPDPAPDEALG
ncbi:MAG: rod-binding protein [Treponema sp.]|jgi:flagellar protein FlgJ|nr:rod-binding protein [Treponema sp.]